MLENLDLDIKDQFRLFREQFQPTKKSQSQSHGIYVKKDVHHQRWLFCGISHPTKKSQSRRL